jgi:hypothetical protein
MDLRSGFALREQIPGDPQIHDAPVGLRKAFEKYAIWARLYGCGVDTEGRGGCADCGLPEEAPMIYRSCKEAIVSVRGRPTRTGVDGLSRVDRCRQYHLRRQVRVHR